MITGLNHFGMAVENLEEQIVFYESLGFQVFKRFSYDAIGAKAAMMRQSEAGIELWEIRDIDSELGQKIKKHSAFTSDDLESDIEAYLAAGYELAIPLSNGNVVKRYAYLKDAAGNYIELVEPLET